MLDLHPNLSPSCTAEGLITDEVEEPVMVLTPNCKTTYCGVTSAYLLVSAPDGKVHPPLVDLGAGKLIYIKTRSKRPGLKVYTSNDDKFAAKTKNEALSRRGILPDGGSGTVNNEIAFAGVTTPTECLDVNPAITFDINETA